jgi:hypothetical protein
MGHNRNLADYAHHFDGTNIDLGSGNIETEGVLTYEDVTNVDAIGIITARTGVKVPDSQKILLGDSSDLQIYHDGSHSYIDETGTGQLIVKTSQFLVRNPSNADILNGGSGGEVNLYHDNSKKFETTTTGATVTGTLVSDGVTSELDLSAISSSISDTAVDVFVYDTFKDSDGGAWRKRTQHTSWYNETLGTATRGSRREFPAVAVIVMQEGTLTIYDGDDPDLPMWMIFTDNNDTGSLFASAKMLSCRTATSISMLNGMLMCGGKGPYHDGVTEINFLTDSAKKHMNNGYYYSTLNISQRESTGGYYTVTSGTPSIVNNLINDVAMTVLPNAPIDDTTGLPVPTIAVATNGGVSVIKDDRTVVDITASGYTATDNIIDFDYLNNLLYLESGGFPQRQPIPSADIIRSASGGRDRVYGGTSSYVPTILGTSSNIVTNSDGFLSGSTSGLSILDYDSSQSQEMVAYATTSYNTGYMHGDIKGAFLSDTNTTNVNADTLNSANTFDGTFATSTGWTTDSDWTISGGVATCNGNNSGRFIYPTNDRWTGSSVVVEVTVTAYTSGTLSVSYGTGAATSGTNMTATGTYKFVNLTTGNDLIYLRSDSFVGSIDNVKIYYAEYDRSVNNKGLIPYGTITKSAVATGAELVAYSGFSASNHLAQPYNSDLNPGSGSYSVVAWFKTESNNSGEGVITGLGNSDIDEVMIVYVNSSYGIYFDYGSSSEYVHLSNSNDRSMVRDGNWHQVVCQVTAGQIGEIYIDGIKKSTAQNVAAPSTWSQWDTNYRLYVGCGRGLGTLPFSGSISLVRYSLSKMSTEQIKKIYEDEKVLFQENAKATLYGSSNAVTALAYDEDTELLHVGTSAGRSDFQGLRRINNTTTAVTTAISASDELIAEQ